MRRIKFTEENFNKLVKLHMYAQEVADLGYIASKSTIGNVLENLKKLSDRLYKYRDEQFDNVLEWEEV